jgi:prepilin-type N-terminal cleavage/methylation domain-containing protein
MTIPRVNLRRWLASGFTLIEIVLVVVVLGVVSGMLIPQFNSSGGHTQEAAVKDVLRYMRNQIQVYKAQHGQTPPGYPGDDTTQVPNAVTFVAQMTQYTDVEGHVSGRQGGRYLFGPYLSDLPTNPISSRKGILVVPGAKLPSPDPSQPYGWVYSPQTQQIVANLRGVDSGGEAYAEY